jgi:hypothetical protein
MKASIFMVVVLARIPPSNEAIDASMLANITAQAASRRPGGGTVRRHSSSCRVLRGSLSELADDPRISSVKYKQGDDYFGEPVFGQIKQARGFRQFLLHGIE